MKTGNLFRLAAWCFLILGLSACGDDETSRIHPLIVDVASCEVPLRRSSEIPIVSGNGRYALEIGNPALAEATVLFADASDTYGAIRIIGKQKGETSLAVTDSVTRETVTLALRIIDNYLATQVTLSNHPALAGNVWMYLADNDAHDCYFFGGSADEAAPVPVAQLLARGKYAFSVEAGIPYLILTYPSDADGKFAGANAAAVAHTFDISGSDKQVPAILKSYLGVDWEELSKGTRTSVQSSYWLKMKETGTAFETEARLSVTPPPVGFLN